MTVVVLPVVRIERSFDEPPISPQEDLLKRIGWAIGDCIDDEHPGIAHVLEEARDEILRLNNALAERAGDEDSPEDSHE